MRHRGGNGLVISVTVPRMLIFDMDSIIFRYLLLFSSVTSCPIALRVSSICALFISGILRPVSGASSDRLH